MELILYLTLIFIKPKSQIQNQEFKLIKTKLGLLNLTVLLGNAYKVNLFKSFTFHHL